MDASSPSPTSPGPTAAEPSPAAVDTHPYNHYLFFEVGSDFCRAAPPDETKLAAFRAHLEHIAQVGDLIVTTYATLGFTPGTTFMFWIRATSPDAVTNLLPILLRTGLGSHLTLTHSYFGIVRPSQYSGRTGKPEQVMQNYPDRLPYFILYPFTKTADWYLLSPENRRAIMGQHIKTGLTHPAIRQCLLYSTGLDNQEFLVSYETPTLEEFQDLVIEMRSTLGRQYTLADTPIYTCLYKPLPELLEWL